MLTTTFPDFPTRRFARRTRLMCPACRYPIVGTKPTRRPARCQLLARRCMAARDFTIRISGAEKRREDNFAPVKFSCFGSMPELQWRGLRHFVRARLIGR